MKRIASIFLLFMIAPSLVPELRAGNLKLHGVVMDKVSRTFVSGARVSASGQQATNDAVTDSEGIFLLQLREGIRPGDIVRIRVYKAGYEAYDREEAASPEKTLEILLQPAVPATPPKSIPKPSPLPDASDVKSHPIVSASMTNVAWKQEERRMTVTVRLHNSGTAETMAHISFAFFWNSAKVKPDIPDRNIAFAPEDKIELTSEATFSQRDAASFAEGTGTLSVRVTAQYLDRGDPTLYVLEGSADSKSDHLTITQSDWSHQRNLGDRR